MVVVAGLVATLLAGSTPVEERLVLRGLLPALDVAQVRTPLDEFRDYTKRPLPPESNVFDDRLLEVRGAPRGTRLRFAALDTYDGTRWAADNDTDPERVDDRFLRLSSTLDNPADGDRLEAVVTPLRGWAIPWVPTAGSLQGFDFLGAADDALTDQLRYDPATQTGVMTGTLEPGDRYVVDTVVADVPVDTDLEPSAALDEDLYDAAAFLDPAVQAWSAGASSPSPRCCRWPGGSSATAATATAPSAGRPRSPAGTPGGVSAPTSCSRRPRSATTSSTPPRWR